jgi:uncharacterized membrane protein
MPRNHLQELPTYSVPPEVINAGFKLFGLTLFQMFILALSVVLAVLTLILFPLGVFAIKLIVGLTSFSFFAGFFLVPIPALTPFEQAISLVNYKRAKIPVKTSARPMPRIGRRGDI